MLAEPALGRRAEEVWLARAKALAEQAKPASRDDVANEFGGAAPAPAKK